MTGIQKYEARADQANSLVCVGLDSELAKLPERFRELEHPQFEFNKWIIEQTHEHVAAYKPNTAFYEARGSAGLADLELTVDYLRESHPDIFLICDAKRNEIGNSSRLYAEAIFDHLGFDACTLNPYLGQEALAPFLEREDKVCVILCRTSNPGAGEFQDLEAGGRPLWQAVADKVHSEWNSRSNCMLVVGATYPEEMRAVREMTGDMTFLVPGVGQQGGSVEKAVAAGLNASGRGMIINSSRGVIFAADPGTEARKLKEEINRFREPKGDV